MNFFQHQEQALRNSKRLIYLFILAVICLVFLSNLIMLLLPINVPELSFVIGGYSTIAHCISEASPDCHWLSLINWRNVFYLSTVIVLIIASGSFYKYRQISVGGKAVAEYMGAEKVPLNTRTYLDKRLLNIVQ
ncbi:MAG: hypothetical protein HRU21_00005, partial [Pseudomonadales bacterium]|nr:hypothetical protein [Pseudomonadales bacterium]